MNTTKHSRLLPSLPMFMIASMLIHTLLLCIPLTSPIIPEVVDTKNRLIAVELLMPEAGAKKIQPDSKADIPSIPRPAPKKKAVQATKTQPKPSPKETPAVPSKEATVSLDRLSEDDVQYRTYLGHLRSKIGTVWTYPPAARDKGLNGTVTVRFSISHNGTLQALSIKNNSPHKLLDKEALRTIRTASPFMPFPADFSIETLHVLASFEYEFSDH